MTHRGSAEATVGECLRIRSRRDDRGRVRVAGSRGGSHLVLVPRRELQDAPHQLRVRGGILGHHLPNPHAARARAVLDAEDGGFRSGAARDPTFSIYGKKKRPHFDVTTKQHPKRKKSENVTQTARAGRTSGASERGTRAPFRAKRRFARSCVAMTRSPLAFAAGWVCVFALMFAPRADAWNPNPNKLLPYEHCTGEGGECTCHGIARWGWPMDTEKHPEYEDGYQWVRPPSESPRVRPPRAIAKGLAPRARRQHPCRFPRNRARP